MHVKSENLKSFWYRNLLFKKIKESEGKAKWVQEEGDQENKKIKQKRKLKKEVNAKRDKQKQKVMKKGRKKNL